LFDINWDIGRLSHHCASSMTTTVRPTPTSHPSFFIQVSQGLVVHQEHRIAERLSCYFSISISRFAVYSIRIISYSKGEPVR
jgi:hypothetical protein